MAYGHGGEAGLFEAVQAAVAQIGEELGPVEILVNNAGITRDGTMHRMDFEQWNAVIQTNLSSCFNMSRAVIEGMREREFGRIVNIGSINGQAGQYGQVNYAAAKSGIHGLVAHRPPATFFGATGCGAVNGSIVPRRNDK